jgi:hypothetical protein
MRTVLDNSEQGASGAFHFKGDFGPDGAMRIQIDWIEFISPHPDGIWDQYVARNVTDLRGPGLYL